MKMDRQNLWKAKPLQFGSQAAKLARAERQEARRRQQRNEYLERIRDIQPSDDDEEEFIDTPEDRAARLIKWKAERDLKKKMEAKNKRPIFKIGVPHHNFYSPTAGEIKPHIHKKPKEKTPKKKISKVTQRRLEAKAAAAALSGKLSTSHLKNRDISQPSTSTAVTPPQPRMTRSRKKAQENLPKTEVSLAPENYAFKIPNGLSSIPLFGEFVYPDTESAILDFNLNLDTKNRHNNDGKLDYKKSDTSGKETSVNEKLPESMSPQKKSPKQVPQSIQDSDSSIESIELRLSSQSESLKIDEDNFPKTENKMESEESDESRIATLPEQLSTSKDNTNRVKLHLRNRTKQQAFTSTTEIAQPRVTRSRRNAPNNTATRGISSETEVSHPDTDSAILHSNMDDGFDKNTINEKAVIIDEKSNTNFIKTDKSPEKLTQKDSDKLTPIETSQSIQASDSSIESIVLRMSSQSEALQLDENNLQNTEIVTMNVDSDEPSRSFSPVPAQFSPFIVTSRGKSSARKEQKQRLSLHLTGSSDDDIPTKETVLQQLNISIEEEERTAQYYKFLTEREENRLKDLCTVWEAIQAHEETTEDGHYMINQAIGQTNLLLRKKFDRFRSLVRDCETGKGEQLVCCRDLQGFWVIVEREIRDCESRFSKLEELKAKNWVEEEEPEMIMVKKKPTAMKKKIITAKSNMKSFIEAARKKKKLQENAMEEDVPQEPKIEVHLSSVAQRKKLPMYPVSPHSRGYQTPRTDRTSLLKLVQLSENAKRMAQNSFAIVKVSQKCKTPEVQHDKSITYVNSEQKPGRGILKKAEVVQKIEGKLNKSINKVNFNDTVEMSEESEKIEDIESNRRSLATALARIEALDFDYNDAVEEETKINKKLEFDDDENDECGDIPQEVSELRSSQKLGENFKEAFEATHSIGTIPAVTITEATPPCNTYVAPEPSANKTAAIPAVMIIEATPQSKTSLSPDSENERATRKTTKGKNRKSVEPGVTINITEATPVSEAPRNSKKERTEEMEIEAIAAESMPAPRLLRKGRGRRTDPVENARIENASTTGKKKFHEKINTAEIILDSELPVRRQTRNHSISTANTAEKKCHTPKSKKSQKKKSIELEELRHHSDDRGDKENVSGMDNQIPQTPTTPVSLINLNSSQLRRSARKSVKFVLEDDCTACKPVPLTPRSAKIRMSFFGPNDSELVSQPLPNGDLMAFDSPMPRRSRLRRSSTK